MRTVVKNCEKGKGVFAAKPFFKGEKILKIKGKVVDYYDEYCLQIGEYAHIKSSGDVDDYLNHSCDPNTYIDFDDLCLKAIKDIRKKEEITWNYNTTEYFMDGYAFECECGSDYCYGELKGFKDLCLEEKLHIKEYLSPYLKLKLLELLKKPGKSLFLENKGF